MTDTTLASWNDGPAKRAIIDFVGSATEPGPDFVEVADRIATFDNDGTLWVEQPLPPQFDFVFRKWAEEIKADPSLAGQQPYRAIVEKDQAFFAGGNADVDIEMLSGHSDGRLSDDRNDLAPTRLWLTRELATHPARAATA